jgi:hypothetical protein
MLLNYLFLAAEYHALRSSGQSTWLQIQRSWFRFPALLDFPRSSEFGTGPAQPREDNCRQLQRYR